MSVTQIDLDDEGLAQVMRIAGVHTKKEAVNLAMSDYDSQPPFPRGPTESAFRSFPSPKRRPR